MKEQIEETLQCLIGLSFWRAGRALNLLIFHFGPRQLRTDHHDGKPYEIGTYALHVQCAWRIVQRQDILAASRDRHYEPREEHEEIVHCENKPYPWPKENATLLDEQLLHFFLQCEKTPIYVQALRADDWGGLILDLNYGIILSIFPDSSSDDECWRFFKIDEDSPHFVITGEGIEDQEEEE